MPIIFTKKAMMMTLTVAFFMAGLMLARADFWGDVSYRNPAIAAANATGSGMGEHARSGRNTGFFASMQNWQKEALLRARFTDDQDAFLTLSTRDLRDLFGTPALTRKEGEFRMVQYRRGSCMLDLFYHNGEKDPLIAHYEFRTLSENASCSSEEFLSF